MATTTTQGETTMTAYTDKTQWHTDQQEQARAIKAYWARVRDMDSREAWMREQYAKIDYEWAEDFVRWQTKHTKDLESAWLLHCDPVDVATLESDESFCG